ncbi:MAG: outer membrane protein assembly factor BamA [Bacteriovoracia bacterium]
MGAHAAPPLKVTTDSPLRSFEGKRVVQIDVTGMKRIEKDAILGKLVTQKGHNLSRDSIKKDIQSVYDMGFFHDIEVSASEVAGGIALTYELRERPVISELKFEGNERIDTDELTDVVKTKEWSILDVNRLREDAGKIQKHYEDRGFYLAKVNFDITPVKGKEDEVHVAFKINDYEKVQIKKITFLNNKKFSQEALKATFGETQEGSFWSFINSSGNFKETAFKQDLQRLTYWYLDHGYVKFRYENPVVTVSDDKRWLYISIYVDEGEQYSMNNIDFGGDLLFSKDELATDLLLTQEKTFKITERNLDIQRLTEKYQDLGYAFVNVIPKMNFNEEKRTIDMEYYFEKGNLVYFGEINMVGNSKTHDKVIRREMRVHEGELYNGTNLRISRERVERLGYFAPGEVVFNQVTRKGRDDLVDIEIQVKERSTGTVTLGAGYGSVQKFFFTTQISEINLLGRGQVLSLQAQYALDNLQRSINLGFTDPYAFDTKWSMGFDVYSTIFSIPNAFAGRRIGFDVRLGYPLMDDLNAYLTYKNESLNIIQRQQPGYPPASDEGILSSVTTSVVRDKRNNRYETTEGNYQSVSLETAGVGGDKKFLKWIMNGRYYKRLIGDLVFRSNLEYGQMAEIGGYSLPSSEKFYLGGPNNMRGYNFFSLGDQTVYTNVNGQLASRANGGAVELFTMFEVEYPLIREAGLKWVLFFDAGNLFDRFPGTGGEPFYLRTDWGFGFRWFSPIGPLRFEWGFPMGVQPGEDSGPVFQFFIGPPF